MCRLQVNSPDTITLDHRSKLLTQRVRTIMSAFFANRNYFSETPNITWDDSFVPPELYDDLGTELASVDAKKSQQVLKERAGKSPKKKVKERKVEKKAKPTKKDKGKAKGTGKNKEKLEKPDVTKNPKRKRTQETSVRSVVIDITGDNEDNTSADKAEPPAKRIKHKKSINDVGITPAPGPPHRQCTSSQLLSKSIAELDSSRNFDLEHMQQQLKASQMELHIAQQQLQLANSRNEAQQNFYEAQRDLYEAQLADYRSQMRGQGSRKAKKA